MGKTNGSLELESSLFEQRLSRARFLRLVRTGVGLSFIPASLAVLGRASSAQPTTLPTILTSEKYPIGLWWPPPPTHTTVQRYEEIVSAGFNFVIGGNGVTNDNTNPGALQAATASELWFLLTDSRLQTIIRDSSAAASASAQQAQKTSIMQFLLTRGNTRSASRATTNATASESRRKVRRRIQQLLELYAGYPALAGLNLYDEPSRAMFGIVGYAREVLQGSTPEELPYVNVWPSYASSSALGTSTYEEYLKLYLSEVKPPLLCFDHYPLLSGTQITSDYFYNWAVIRRFSLQAGIPSWVFIQSVDFWGDIRERRRPNEPEILWQVNVSLAYGAKGIQYFTYWTPKVAPDASIQFGEALVSVDGQLTPLYDYAKRINNYLRVVGKVLLPLTSVSVVHANENPLPLGAKPFAADGYVQSVSGSPVMLGKFRNSAEGTTERYFLVVNRSFANEAETQLTLSNSVSEVFELDSQTGTFVPVAQQGTLLLRIAPGGARLYLLRTS